MSEQDRQGAETTESIRRTNEILPDVFDELIYEGSDGNIAEYSFISPRVGGTTFLSGATCGPWPSADSSFSQHCFMMRTD